MRRSRIFSSGLALAFLPGTCTMLDVGIVAGFGLGLSGSARRHPWRVLSDWGASWPVRMHVVAMWA